MRRFRSIGFCCVALGSILSCASAGSPGKAADKIIPPKMVSHGPMPQMHFMRSLVPGAQTYRADIEVVIDSTGVPDMSTFKVSGSAAAENREALLEWIRTSTYRPATRNGQPVSAVLHTTLEFRAG